MWKIGVRHKPIFETEVPIGFPENLLNCGSYNLELEQNTMKKRVGIYLHKDLNYLRRRDLEKEDLHIVIIDIKLISLESLNLSFVHFKKLMKIQFLKNGRTWS